MGSLRPINKRVGSGGIPIISDPILVSIHLRTIRDAIAVTIARKGVGEALVRVPSLTRDHELYPIRHPIPVGVDSPILNYAKELTRPETLWWRPRLNAGGERRLRDLLIDCGKTH